MANLYPAKINAIENISYTMKAIAIVYCREKEKQYTAIVNRGAPGNHYLEQGSVVSADTTCLFKLFEEKKKYFYYKDEYVMIDGEIVSSPAKMANTYPAHITFVHNILYTTKAVATIEHKYRAIIDRGIPDMHYPDHGEGSIPVMFKLFDEPMKCFYCGDKYLMMDGEIISFIN